METKVCRTLPEELLYTILAKLPMRVLGIMKTVCKQWNYLLSSRDALQVNNPNWSLHSTHGFLIQIHWDLKDDVESWVIEGAGSEIYKVPLPNHVVVNTCKSIFCCHLKGDLLDLSIGVPGSGNWRNLPRSPIYSYFFSGMAFDSSARRCTLLFGNIYYYSSNWRGQRDEGDDITIVMSIYDSDSNAWSEVSMEVPYHIQPCGKGIYSNGKFYWAAVRPNPRNVMVAFDIAEGAWTEIPLPRGCSMISPENLGEYNGQVVLVEQTSRGRLRIWKLTEAEKYEIWCKMRTSSLVKCIFPCFCSVTVNSSGLIMVIDTKLNMSIYNSKGEVIAANMKLPGHRTAQLPIRISVLVVESNNLWWP